MLIHYCWLCHCLWDTFMYAHLFSTSSLIICSNASLTLLFRNQFVMEYCGEVMNYKDFQERAERYDRENRRHYYFMTLRADEVNCKTLLNSFESQENCFSFYQFLCLSCSSTYYIDGQFMTLCQLVLNW